MPSPRALACPGSLKGVLSARAAAAALARGLGGCDELPLAHGGEGTADVVPGLVEAASGIPFDPAHLDPFTSSRPFGELLASMDADRLLIGLGGTANMDAGGGMFEVLDALPPATVLCDVRTTLYDAPRLYGPQKGATPEQVAELERRFRTDARLAPYAHLPGPGAAGGLGGALAPLPCPAPRRASRGRTRTAARRAPTARAPRRATPGPARDARRSAPAPPALPRTSRAQSCVSSTRAPNPPSASATSTRAPGATSAATRTTLEPVRTMA